MGCVMLLMNEEDKPLAEEDQRLAQTVAGFLGRQMESSKTFPKGRSYILHYIIFSAIL